MKTLQVAGHDVYQFLPGNRRAQRSVLFSQATSIDALSYKDVLQRCANEHSNNVFTFDARGHKPSEFLERLVALIPAPKFHATR